MDNVIEFRAWHPYTRTVKLDWFMTEMLLPEEARQYRYVVMQDGKILFAENCGIEELARDLYKEFQKHSNRKVTIYEPEHAADTGLAKTA